MEQKLTCYSQFADTVFKNGKRNHSLPYLLNNVVPLIKLRQETINMSALFGRVEEGSGMFVFGFFFSKLYQQLTIAFMLFTSDSKKNER